MTLATIDAWLTDLGLGKYIDVFAENDVDMRVLAALTDDDFRELGVSLGAVDLWAAKWKKAQAKDFTTYQGSYHHGI